MRDIIEYARSIKYTYINYYIYTAQHTEVIYKNNHNLYIKIIAQKVLMKRIISNEQKQLNHYYLI